MSENTPPKSRMKTTYTAIGMAVGLVLGGLFGLIADNLALSAGGGMVIGLALGAALDRRSQKNQA